MSTNQQAILDSAVIHALKALAPATTRQIASALGVPLAVVRGAIRRMTKDGIVRCVRRGKHTLYRLS